MVTLRCTRKLLKFLDINPVEVPEPPTGKLGDWYANLVPTDAGDLIIFVNERSLVTVAVPTWDADNLVPLFCSRVKNLFRMLDVSEEHIHREIRHYQDVQYAKTASRSIVGSMNDISWHYQFMAERGDQNRSLSLSEAELKLSNMPSIAMKLFPADAAKALIKTHISHHGTS